MILVSNNLLDIQRARMISKPAIVIKDGSILAVGPADSVIRHNPGHRLLFLKNAVLMPGLVNAHTHLELPPLLDSIRAGSFPQWVLNLIKKKKEFNSKDYAAAVKENIRTLIQTGTTTVAEICTQGISPAHLKQSSLRSVIYREIISMKPGKDNQSGLSLRSISRLLSAVPRQSSLIKRGLSPHAPHTVSTAILQQIMKYSSTRDISLCMHVAESKDELNLLKGKKNGFENLYETAGWDLSWAPRAHSSIEYLDQIGMLSPRLLAVHAVQVTDKDIDFLKQKLVPVAHCPRSNRETGVGRMPLGKFLKHGITVGLGTDSLASSPSLNMWDEMRTAFQIHRKDGITDEDIFRLATSGGAKALGLDKVTGSLEPGKKADIIAVQLPQKSTGNLYSDLLRETKSCIMSMVNGKLLLRDY
jgi:cytosine/adenosine deaminase-related metal-dependent hydrolase